MQPPSQVAQRFGRAVRQLRLNRGLTQQQLADACRLDISYVGGIERGQRNPTLGVMHGLASVLGVRISGFAQESPFVVGQPLASEGGLQIQANAKLESS